MKYPSGELERSFAETAAAQADIGAALKTTGGALTMIERYLAKRESAV